MKPKKLILCAWGPYKDKEEVDFTTFYDRGIFLITGATGAGKTTIFDAISYALYGALSGDERDKERNSVRSDFAEPLTPTYVELTMEHGGAEYQIRRNPEYFRPKKKKSTKDSSLQLTKEKENAILYYPDGRVLEGVREVNAALQELLGLDYQQFKKISMIAQGEFARLLIAPPKEKTKIFREIFGTGVYERFTQGLSVRARQLYGKVMEHKSKLVEDVRLLSVDIHKSGWREELRDRFEQITATDNWNYEELVLCLKQMEQEALEMVQLQRKEYELADKEVARLTTIIAEGEQNNKNLEQLEEVKKEQERLDSLGAEYAKKELDLKKAQNAGFVEGTEEKKKNLESQVTLNAEEQKRTTEEQLGLRKEQKALEEIAEGAARIRELLHQKKTLRELEQEIAKLQEEYRKKKQNLEVGREKYLKEETEFRRMKADYEEAEHRRNLAAIGLVATLLEEGKPCPVCGSLQHPAPAKLKENVISEEELKNQKKEIEKREGKLQDVHVKLIAMHTQTEGMSEQISQMTTKCKIMQEELLEEQNPLYKRYLELPTEQALAKLEKECDRAGKIAGLLQEKASYEKRLQLQAEQLTAELEEITLSFDRLLKQYGFENEDSYRDAKRSAGERDKLQQELATYQNKIVANREIYNHLKETTKNSQKVDLQEKKDILYTAKKNRDEVLKIQKLWEQNQKEVKKTWQLMCEKLERIEEDSAEYGYIKDLENMATGNNPKKLVFEQYVLAGYFEEILRAANIRFRKMTAGRYEMERVSEVGDGRVKDNLEIQVLDYYTGKYRSVRTLSGGESFKASLALALGMSDVIQSMNGGIRVDTLFVDEGFGALDEESLNQACDTLMGLVEKNHLIGIISHVPELRQRIDRQLIIDKTGSGSTIRNSVK